MENLFSRFVSITTFLTISFKKSLTGAGIMLTWYLTESLWLPANAKFKTD